MPEAMGIWYNKGIFQNIVEKYSQFLGVLRYLDKFTPILGELKKCLVLRVLG